MINKFLAFLLAFCFATVTWAATLLPNGKQVFFNGNGQPLAGGSVSFYIPSTTTYKTTWQDPSATIPNSNPVILDANGSAIIYGNGVYREVVTDVFGNLIWDQLTADTSQGTTSYSWGGTSTGTPNNQIVGAATFSYTSGQIVGFKPSATNTGAFTLVVSGSTPISVYKDTALGPVPLTGGEIIAGNTLQVVYDATLGAFHLVSYPAGSQAVLPLASNATTDIGSLGTTNVSITGSATITNLGSSASTTQPVYRVISAGTATLTNGPALSLPGATNITMQSGDSFIALYTGGSNWQVLSYTRQADSPFVPSKAVMAFNLSACPPGWSAANGSGGTVNLVGYFIRGLDTSGVVDPTPRTLGSIEAYAVQSHSHGYNAPSSVGFIYGGGSTGGVTGQIGANTGGPSGNVSTETRPVNVALLYCQKN